MFKEKYAWGILIIFALLLGGCAGSPQAAPNKPKSLKVMYYSEEYFNQQYGDVFRAKYPDIEIEVLDYSHIDYASEDDVDKAEIEFIKREQPDVLLLEAEQYERYIEEGLLMELDTFIHKDNYDLQSIYPAIIELLQEKGNGKIYGLSPRFYETAVFYNKTLFEKYGITPPQDKMTWAELIELAKRFPQYDSNGGKLYGFGLKDGLSFDILADRIALTQGLRVVNSKDMKVTINSDAWREVLQLALDACASKNVYIPPDEQTGSTYRDYLMNDPFINGSMAMTVDDLLLLQDLENAQGRNRDYAAFSLGAAAGPVDSHARDLSNDIQLKEIWSIRNGSPNAETAWEFIKYVNSDDYARVKGKTMDGFILSRIGHYEDLGIDLNAFYSLRPNIANHSMEDNIPDKFYPSFEELMQRELQKVAENQVSLDEAIKQIQTAGQFILDDLLKKK